MRYFQVNAPTLTSVSKPVVIKLKLQKNLVMTSYYTSLYCVNNRLNPQPKNSMPSAKGSASDDMGRSDQKINRQLPQVSARLHQRKRRTL